MNQAIENEELSTSERVAIAAHEMLREGRGQAITQRAIYEAIGNRGSMTTIQQALGDWWVDLGEHLQQLEYFEGFPPEVLSALLEAFAGIRTQAEARARAEFEAATQAANDEVEAAQAERTAALEALATTKQQVVDLKHQVDQLVDKRDALKQQLDAETERRLAIEGEIPDIRQDAQDRIEQAEKQIQQAKQQNEGLQEALAKEEGRHKDTKTSLKALYEQERSARALEHTEAAKAQERLQEKLEALNQAYLQEKEDGANLTSLLREEVSRSAGKVEQLEASQQQLQAELDKCRAEKVEMADDLSTTKTERRHDQARISELEEACVKLETTCIKKDQKITRLSSQLEKEKSKKEK